MYWKTALRARSFGKHIASTPMQRGARFFQEIAFPCSVGRCCVVMPRCGVRSRVTFSSTWGATVFVVLHLWRSGALFFDSLWPSVAVRSIALSPVFPFRRSGALFFDVGAFWGTPCWRSMQDQKYSKSVPMQRGARSFLRRSVPMQRGTRFLIFDIPLGGPTWPQ